MPPPDALLAVEDVKVHFPVRGGVFSRAVGTVKAVDGVSFGIGRAETLGLVGESGCGKSTVGLALMGLVRPTAGRIALSNLDVASLRGADLKAHRRRMQIVFQDPYSSLNPRQRVEDLIRAPLDIHGVGAMAERRERVARLMERVGLRRDQARNYPHEFSGGQRQRIGIARALALNPEIVVCDEPVSALDVSVQAQILNLLVELQQEFRLSYLFVSHDLSVVEHVSHRVAVMYLGRIVEIGARAEIFSDPRHPYTELLLKSAPAAHPRQRRAHALATGEAPSAISRPSGCAFHPRCPLATEKCVVEDVFLSPRGNGRSVACHYR